MSRSEEFRVLIAVHRPRYRGRAERAAAVGGWDVLSLQNKQDPVGQVQKGLRPPDLVVLSSDFGRQKSFGIFRAIQAFRERGMKIVGMVESLEPGETGINAAELCDICIAPPFKTADLRVLFLQLFEEITGEPAPTEADAAEETDDQE